MASAASYDEPELKPRGRTFAPHSDSASSTDSANFGLEGLLVFQTAILESMTQTNRRFFDRMSSEGALMEEFAKKLMGGRSIPEVASAFQDLSARHLAMAIDDTQNFWLEMQKLMDKGPFWRMTPPGSGTGGLGA